MRRTVGIALSLLVLGLSACWAPETDPSAATVIDRAMDRHGSDVLDRAVVSFDFRNDDYWIRQNDGLFHYRRSYTDSLDRRIIEGLANDSTYRRVNDSTVTLSTSERESIETTINSVVYFALLPEPLGDPAVQPSYTGRDTIDGVPYHRVRVTFQQEGGGDDWQDIFMYWFHTDTYAMNYLAYAYGLEPDEEFGTRFREAYNVRRRNGVRFADYHNFTVDTLTENQLSQYPELWADGSARLVSNVELDSVHVRPLP